MNLEYSSSDELIELIRQINLKYYERLNANILFLEELSDRIFVIYIIELRMLIHISLGYLITIFILPQGKKNVQSHLGNYVDHFQRGLLDTFRKIFAFEFNSIKKSIHRNNVKAVEYQIAHEAPKLRIMGEGISADDRIKGYLSLLNYISEIRKKFASAN